MAERTTRQKNAILEHPLYEPLRKLGVHHEAVARLFQDFSPARIEKWVRITDAALHEKPRGFAGFRISAAAFLIDGVQSERTAPDWFHAHEKQQREAQQQVASAKASLSDNDYRVAYEQARTAALNAFLASGEGRRLYEEAYVPLLALATLREPDRAKTAAENAARARTERLSFQFPTYEEWRSTGQPV